MGTPNSQPPTPRGLHAPATHVLLAIVATTAVKLIVTVQLELTSVEAYHWMYARHPALGYHDHPAMIGWLVALSTAVFGHGALGVRLAGIAGGAAAVWLTFLAARRLYDGRVGRLAALLTATAPLFFAFGSWATPDAPLLLFGAAALWALAHALSDGRIAWWGAAGAFLGWAMLSKYNAVLLGAGALIFLVLSPEHRAWLRRPHPYVAALAALAAFAPAIVWNAQNGWASFGYQGVERFAESRGFEWRGARDFAAGQLLLLTPALAAWAWMCGVRAFARWRASPWQDRLLAALGMPALVFFTAMVALRSVRPHWPDVGYVSLVVLVAAAVGRGGKWGRWLHAGTIAVMAAAYVALPVALAFVPREHVSGWAQLAAHVRRVPHDFVVARDYHDASQLGYHLRPAPACDFTAVGRPAKSFRGWWRAEEHAGRDAVVVFRGSDGMEGIDRVRAHFDRVDEPVEVEVTRWGGRRERFVLVRASGYRP